jgi:hypothetical protein
MSPDRLASSFDAQNRWADWRADLAQSLFLSFAAAATLAFVLFALQPIWPSVFARAAPWGGMRTASGLGVLVALACVAWARQYARRLALQHQRDWLAALPIPAQARQRHRQQRGLLQIGWRAGLALALLLWGAATAGGLQSMLLACLAAGLGVGVLLSIPATKIDAVRLVGREAVRPLAAAVRIKAETRGLALLGAAIEPAVARLPRSARWVAFALFLVPVGMPLVGILVLVLFLGALGLAVDLLRHWRERYLIDLAWLAALPLPGRRLLLAYVPFLLRRALPLIGVVGASLYAMGAPAWFALLAGLLLAAALAHAVVCSYAARLSRRRFALLLSTQYLILFASVQVLPLALPLVLLLCVGHAWRLGERQS